VQCAEFCVWLAARRRNWVPHERVHMDGNFEINIGKNFEIHIGKFPFFLASGASHWVPQVSRQRSGPISKRSKFRAPVTRAPHLNYTTALV
jgi:hypothetical protein